MNPRAACLQPRATVHCVWLLRNCLLTLFIFSLQGDFAAAIDDEWTIDAAVAVGNTACFHPVRLPAGPAVLLGLLC